MSESHGSESPIRRPLRRQPHTQQQQPDPLNCPRCESTNTKFCYYNNYNKTQPRYFCKACKRHWTKGGTLRNVPIGGGWKNKRLRRPNNTAISSMVNRNNSSIDHDSPSDPKETCDASKTSFTKPTGSKRRDDVESYIDIEELKGLVSWDFYGSFIGSTMQELGHEDLPRLGCSKLSSSFETNSSSNTPRSFIEILENGEDSTIPSSMIMPSSQQTNNILELSNWDWDDFDTSDQ